MKGVSSYVADTHMFYSSPSLRNCNHPLISCQQNVVYPCNFTLKVKPLVRDLSFNHYAGCAVQNRKKNDGFVVGCANWGLEREPEAEIKTQEDDEEKGIGRFRHKCGEREGVVELLECLEKEAIMGEDVGKEPTDYNRRAHIFDTSSKVFQALKEEVNNDDDDGDVFAQHSPP